MKSLKQIREASGGKEAYQKFFNSLLKKFGVSSPSELSGDKKKKFYDALDAGWDGDNEKPEKNERHADPENLDPETTVDGDEDQADKAASHVTEALSKLIGKAGRGKLSPRDAIDIDYMGDRKDIKFDSTKWKINIKGSGDGQALVSGDKKKIIAWLTSDDYGMDDEDIEDLFPELLESRFPKALSIIRQNKVSGDALEEAYDMNEKMVMCEQCGKMHEEGACGEMKESEIHLDAKHDTFKKIKKSKWAAIKKKYNVTIDSDKTGSWAAGKPEDLHKFAVAMGMSKDDIKKTYNHITPDYKGASNLKNKQREEVEEANHFSKKLNKPSKKIFDLALAAIRRNNITDKKEKDEYVDDVAGVSLTPKEVELVKKAIKLESVDEMFSTRSIGLKGASKRSRDKARGAKEMPPTLDALTQRKVKAIAKKHSGDMERALKDIEKLKKGLGDNPVVMDILKKANESVNEATVDRRTKGFKEALKKQEAAKIKREKAKAKQEKKKHQAELDARYDYDGEVDTVLAAANSVMFGKKLPEDSAANNAGDGHVDMAPNAGKKKKKETLLSRRSY